MKKDIMDKYNVSRYPPHHRNVNFTMTIVSYDMHVLQVRTVMVSNCSENGELAEGVSKCILNNSNNCTIIGIQLIKSDDAIKNKR